MAVRTQSSAPAIIETDVPARLDRLPWGRFHTLVVVALGVTWILDGLEVTLAGAVSPALKQSPALQFSNADVGLASSAYLAGAVLGALFFGWLTDRLGRKRLFFITLAVYLVATAATALAWDVWSFVLFRFLTGAGIGGEYTAINSTIQELIPARYRGWTDLVINGSFWIGAAIGAAGSIVLLDPALFAPDVGWRLAFLIGAALGLVIFFMRFWIPESPRWLMTHGRAEEAEAILAQIDAAFLAAATASPRPAAAHAACHAPLHAATRGRRHVVLRPAPAHVRGPGADGGASVFLQRDLLHLCAGPDRLLRHPCRSRRLVPAAVRSRQFSRAGPARPAVRHRRPPADDRLDLCALRRAARRLRLSVRVGVLSATGQTVAWMVIFFFASAAASSAYLTVSETFPLEIRALAIAFFYAIGTGIGGVCGPWLFGLLIDTGSRVSVFYGYLLGSVLMIAAAVVAWRWAVAAERKALESVCRPLAAAD